MGQRKSEKLASMTSSPTPPKKECNLANESRNRNQEVEKPMKQLEKNPMKAGVFVTCLEFPLTITEPPTLIDEVPTFSGCC